MKRSLLTILLALALSLLLSGCISLSTDDMYALPRQSEAYLDLQNAIDAVMTAEMQYSSPVSGANQQPVQMADLDGDGEDEALVFAKSNDVSPLKIFVFDRQEDHYRNICTIEGEGSAFARVEYAQMDGLDGVELVIGRQISEQIPQSLSVYRISGTQPEELISASYSVFTLSDLDGDGNRDLFLLRYGMEEQTGTASLYRWAGETIERKPDLQTAVTADSIRYFSPCNLTADDRGVLVTRAEEDAMITEVFTLRSDSFVKLSSDDLHLSSTVVHGYNVYPFDVDLDGCTELPDVVPISGADDEVEDDEYAIRWYRCEPSGRTQRIAVTYHSYASGWYLLLPDAIGTDFTVSRVSATGNMRGISFYEGKHTQSDQNMLLTIYAFSGSDRSNLASMDGRFPIGTKGDVTYAALPGAAAEKRGITEEDIVGMFRFIRVDWNSGET